MWIGPIVFSDAWLEPWSASDPFRSRGLLDEPRTGRVGARLLGTDLVVRMGCGASQSAKPVGNVSPKAAPRAAPSPQRSSAGQSPLKKPVRRDLAEGRLAFQVHGSTDEVGGKSGSQQVQEETGISEADLVGLGNDITTRTRRRESVMPGSTFSPDHAEAMRKAVQVHEKRERRGSFSKAMINIRDRLQVTTDTLDYAIRSGVRRISVTGRSGDDSTPSSSFTRRHRDKEEVHREIAIQTVNRRQRASFYSKAPRPEGSISPRAPLTTPPVVPMSTEPRPKESSALAAPVAVPNGGADAVQAGDAAAASDEVLGAGSATPVGEEAAGTGTAAAVAPPTVAPATVVEAVNAADAGGGAGSTAPGEDGAARPTWDAGAPDEDTEVVRPNRLSVRAPDLSRGPGRRRSVSISLEMGMEAEQHTTAGFPTEHVGTFSCCGMDDGVKKTNQDFACMAHPVAKQLGTALFCVFDGHGAKGHDVAQEVLYSMHHELERSIQDLLANSSETLAASFHMVNEHLKALCDYNDATGKAGPKATDNIDALDSGATALVVFMSEDQLFVAGAGDTRCVLATTHADGLVAVPLSVDHKVDLAAEQHRLEQAGAWVRPEIREEDEYEPARLYQNQGSHPRDKPKGGPGLCVSRCLGDLPAGLCGLIPTPQVTTHSIGTEDLFMIIASDGVWEFIDNEEAVQIVKSIYDKGGSADQATRFLIAKAAMCWHHFEDGYRDDITAIVVYLQPVVNILVAEAVASFTSGH